ncbi:hypothetical protein GCM10011351_02390 [Paraliobacillus quinghaiensis]|uniref:Zinc-ribbon domain-containing protein n=1 Tax=Paraliobacillus quinghaiensis TaxID=470815 RepID=A0A917TEL8_9BACI|nr:zinc ribbon domain-containing protein [Paraliobacillus quinghaiensis]GGM20075.1 hypothetical protein GCM10011351_02390 [Paraliobacillus quinghaiensis]
MSYCPYCGSTTKEDESFCVHCGKKLPEDIDLRLMPKKNMSRFIYISLAIFIALSGICVGYYYYLQEQTEQALESYKEAEAYLLNGDYQQTLTSLNNALEHKENFPAAIELRDYTKLAIIIEEDLNVENTDYQESLMLINEGKKELSNYSGKAVEQLQEKLNNAQVNIQLEKVKAKLANEPSITTLQTILWEAEGIQDPEAEEIAQSIREQLIAYTSTKANQHIQEKQYSLARSVVENGLRYAPNSEKLLSLKTTIEKEKTAFETAEEQRIEQAMSAVAEEQERNENDAVELINITLSKDDQNNIVVSGELKSVATVPINTISVIYHILDEDGERIVSNETYVYPETLYPDEQGQFDFTHFDLDNKQVHQVEIDTITWFLD